MNTLFLIRGLPGSGKSTLARQLCPDYNFASDDYFEDDNGNYVYKREDVGAAHLDCQQRVCAAMENTDHPNIAVHNTFIKTWELQPYLVLAKSKNYNVMVIHCTNDYGNTHNVPWATLKRMRDSFEPFEYDPTRRVSCETMEGDDAG